MFIEPPKHDGDGYTAWRYCPEKQRWELVSVAHQTEAEALVAALEAARKRGEQ